MTRIVSAGVMQDDKIALALFRAHADASDDELRNWRYYGANATRGPEPAWSFFCAQLGASHDTEAR